MTIFNFHMIAHNFCYSKSCCI